jgi:hypothetical protein
MMAISLNSSSVTVIHTSPTGNTGHALELRPSPPHCHCQSRSRLGASRTPRRSIHCHVSRGNCGSGFKERAKKECILQVRQTKATRSVRTDRAECWSRLRRRNRIAADRGCLLSQRHGWEACSRQPTRRRDSVYSGGGPCGGCCQRCHPGRNNSTDHLGVMCDLPSGWAATGGLWGRCPRTGENASVFGERSDFRELATRERLT